MCSEGEVLGGELFSVALKEKDGGSPQRRNMFSTFPLDGHSTRVADDGRRGNTCPGQLAGVLRQLRSVEVPL